MTSEDDQRLKGVRRSAANFSREDLEQLYLDYGFEFRTRRGKHQIVYHPTFPRFRATMPNHSPFAKAYVYDAIRLIRQYLAQIEEQYPND